VKGQVLYKGKPVAEAMVVFHPLKGAAPDGPKPFAHTDADGRFELTTKVARDGAPAGEYAVTVQLRELVKVGEEAVRDGRNLLPAPYSKPSWSPLRVTVKEGANELEPFRLSEQRK
jgi:hypothetical protein